VRHGCEFLHNAASDCVTLARCNIKDRDHQDLKALVREAAPVEAGYGATEEIKYVAHSVVPLVPTV
jgi:hypothetical protein